jgi:hypothetical protein
MPARRKPKIGRPPRQRYAALFAGLEAPPEDPGEREYWVQGILCTIMLETAQGRANLAMNDQLRRLAEAIQKLTTRERLWKAEKLIKHDAIKRKPKPKGPATEAMLPSRGPLR